MSARAPFPPFSPVTLQNFKTHSAPQHISCSVLSAARQPWLASADKRCRRRGSLAKVRHGCLCQTHVHIRRNNQNSPQTSRIVTPGRCYKTGHIYQQTPRWLLAWCRTALWVKRSICLSRKIDRMVSQKDVTRGLNMQK